jgi:hypothetical protein
MQAPSASVPLSDERVLEQRALLVPTDSELEEYLKGAGTLGLRELMPHQATRARFVTAQCALLAGALSARNPALYESAVRLGADTLDGGLSGPERSLGRHFVALLEVAGRDGGRTLDFSPLLTAIETSRGAF